MTKENYIALLQSTEQITLSDTHALEAIVAAYPYCQSSRALVLKGLKNNGSYNYNTVLKNTAAYTTYRSVLFDFITSENFNQHDISDIIKSNVEHLKLIETEAEDISSPHKTVVDENLQKDIKATETILNPNLFTKKDSEEVLRIGKPLDFNKDETHSFGEWLKLTAIQALDPEDEQTVDNLDAEKTEKFKLIDKFIKTNPKINPNKTSASSVNLAKTQMIPQEELMTETLARVYVEQKKYKEAIKSYKILSLKYPEKSGFFADQIKALKKLQE